MSARRKLKGEDLPEISGLDKSSTPVPTVKELLMRKDDNTGKVPSHPRREPSFEEPIRSWANLPITQDRARELVDLITRREDRDALDALIELICGVMPYTPSDDKDDLDKRFLAGHAAMWHAFTDTTRAHNDLGAYVVGLKCAMWE